MKATGRMREPARHPTINPQRPRQASDDRGDTDTTGVLGDFEPRTGVLGTLSPVRTP